MICYTVSEVKSACRENPGTVFVLQTGDWSSKWLGIPRPNGGVDVNCIETTNHNGITQNGTGPTSKQMRAS